LAAKNNNGIHGILPLFEIRQSTGNKIISVPFSTEGGVLAKNDNAKNTLLSQAKSIVKENNLDYLELRQEKDIGANLRTKDHYYHMKLKLDPDTETVWKNADKKLRNAVRKAEKLGLTTDRGLKYFDDFYRIFSINMRDLGTPVDKKQFFEEIIKQFPNQVDIVVAKLNDKVIGAIFLLKHKKIIKSEWASSYRKYFGNNASQLMYWRAIEDACKEGFEIFDFGRSMLDEGTYQFKRKFGAKPVQLHYKYFMKQGAVPDTRKTNWKRQLFAKCWSRMPLFVANKFGPKLREQFP
jgi:FemAB-related protein (PEP-CTERM system-associated)